MNKQQRAQLERRRNLFATLATGDKKTLDAVLSLLQTLKEQAGMMADYGPEDEVLAYRMLKTYTEMIKVYISNASSKEQHIKKSLEGEADKQDWWHKYANSMKSDGKSNIDILDELQGLSVPSMKPRLKKEE